MRMLLRAISVAMVVLTASWLVGAQQLAAPSGEPGAHKADGPSELTAATNNPPASTEERRAKKKVLLRLMRALIDYLETVDESSHDYQATLQSIREIEAKISGLAEPAAGARPPAPAPAPAAPAPESKAVVNVADTPMAGPAPPSGGPALSGSLRNPAATARVQDAETKEAADFCKSSADDQVTFIPYLNRLVCEKTKALVNQGSNANQTETPSVSENTTSLVDQSSASDLIGVALNLAGLSSGADDDDGEEEATSVSVTASAYSLYAAFKGADPLDPGFYNRHVDWRRFFLTLGYDKEEAKEGETEGDTATIVGGKVLILNGRDAGKQRNIEELGMLSSRLERAGVQFAGLRNQVANYLFTREKIRDTVARPNFKAFIDDSLEDNVGDIKDTIVTANAADAQLPGYDDSKSVEENVAIFRASGPQIPAASLGRYRQALATLDAYERARAIFLAGQARIGKADLLVRDESTGAFETEAERVFSSSGFARLLQRPAVFQQVLGALTAQEEEELKKFISDSINPFVELDTATRRALEAIRSRPQFSAAFLSKFRQKGNDEHKAELIYEQGLFGSGRANVTLNAGFKYVNSKLVGGDSRGGNLSGQLQLQLTPENSLVSKGPIFLTLSTNNEWMSGKKPNYKGQAKVRIPITDGVEFPISFTVANRTDLIDETDVRGQFGFTFDTAKLLRAFKFKLPTGRALDSAAPAP